MLYEKISGFSDEMGIGLEDQFKTLNKMGISYFEPRYVGSKNISDLDECEAKDLKEKMDKYGIKASSIGSPIGKIKITDDFEGHFEVFKRVVETAKILDTKYIRIFSFYHDGDSWTADEREEVLARLKRMVDHAKEKDVVLLHENEKGIYGDTTERCLDLMNELSCDNFRAVFDPANFVQADVDTKKAYEVLKDYIEYMHIKDALSEDNRVVPAGKGEGNVEFILKSLFDNGYDGFLSLEPHLGSFEWLKFLEPDSKMEDLPKSEVDTFVVAYDALCDILKRIR